MNPNDDLDALGYKSSSPDLNIAPPVDVNPQDVEDHSALVRVQMVIAKRKDIYGSTAYLSNDPERLKVFSMNQQLEIAQNMIQLLNELESIVNGAIKDVREKLNER